MELIKVVATKDESGHWYVIPKELDEEFEELAFDEEKEDEFIDKFSKYSTGGDLNLVQLYANIEK
ncbi:MAG: hypothetical protein F6K19_01650 [Cyanothece sp. SIO1E1]|nr:hypothetical protein [Cyanothece sp. SIO1E1]